MHIMTQSPSAKSANDSDLVEILLRVFPGVQEILSIAQRIRNEHGLPVNSFYELERSLGGPGTPIKFVGKTVDLAFAARFVPSFFFPITNEHDLIAKLAELHRKARYQLRLQKLRQQRQHQQQHQQQLSAQHRQLEGRGQ